MLPQGWLLAGVRAEVDVPERAPQGSCSVLSSLLVPSMASAGSVNSICIIFIGEIKSSSWHLSTSLPLCACMSCSQRQLAATTGVFLLQQLDNLPSLPFASCSSPASLLRTLLLGGWVFSFFFFSFFLFLFFRCWPGVDLAERARRAGENHGLVKNRGWVHLPMLLVAGVG